MTESWLFWFFVVGWLVAQEDRYVLRFLWVDDVKAPLPRLIALWFARVVFGVSPSPFLLNTTIRCHVES